jgi:6-phosphogluconate dehydrogenase
MQIGMIGLGRMGGDLVRRLQRRVHSCVVFDRGRARVEALRKPFGGHVEPERSPT